MVPRQGGPWANEVMVEAWLSGGGVIQSMGAQCYGPGESTPQAASPHPASTQANHMSSTLGSSGFLSICQNDIDVVVRQENTSEPCPVLPVLGNNQDKERLIK